MLLSKYIEVLGDKLAAQQLHISERTARAYRCGQTMPHASRAKRIAKQLEHVPVTFVDCFDCEEEII